MKFTRDYLHNDCEGIDAAMFSGDAFLEEENREALLFYICRWVKALPEQAAMASRIDAEVADTYD